METVEFQGKVYTKASVVAKRFKYTPDYIGQLCRAGKVDSRLVGRAWYVHVPSLKEHRSGRYKVDSTTDTANNDNLKTEKNYTKRVVVEPVLHKRVVHILKKNVQTGATEAVPVRYETDDHSLIPKVQKSVLEKQLPVNPAGAKQVRVKRRAKKETYFTTTPIPEVSLKGKLSVEDASDPEPKNEDVQPTAKSESEQNLGMTSRENVVKHSHIGNLDKKAEKKLAKEELSVEPKKVAQDEESSKKIHVASSPSTLVVSKPKRVSHSVVKNVSRKSRQAKNYRWTPILYALIFGGICFSVLLGLRSETLVIENQYSSSATFDLKNFPLGR